MTTIYAIGDIHGHLGPLKVLHERIERDRDRHDTHFANVVHLGDLIDRGPDSADVVDWLMQGQANDLRWIVLTGNHDQLFLEFLENPGFHNPQLRSDLSWLHPKLGGLTTLESYGVDIAAHRDTLDLWRDAVTAVPAAHREYLKGLPRSHHAPGLFFAHAGIRPGVELEDQDPDDLIWIRRDFLNYTGTHPALIVHGHTPLPAPRRCHNRLNLDGGAGYGRSMVAVVIDGGEVYRLTARGRQKMPVAR
ncbi:MAG: metallophosphoesterase [Rhodobacteraceae bacterium]|nr:metallophosphoesterase [Paracoccaceae bacterium]